jgi:protein-L-isoaspartate(D-aspartate) O-methyltransferase
LLNSNNVFYFIDRVRIIDYSNNMDKDALLIHLEEHTEVFNNPSIKEAFTEVDRKDFVDEDYKVECYEDYALPIGFGASISQPTTIAFMLELLEAQEGERVLDVGSGSGYTTALLGNIVGSEGLVYGIEVVPDLVEKGKQNIEKYNLGQIHIIGIKEKHTLYELPQFDRILVNADTGQLPEDLMSMLKVDGTIVLPVEGTIYKIIKGEQTLHEIGQYPGFTFVPYVNM